VVLPEVVPLVVLPLVVPIVVPPLVSISPPVVLPFIIVSL
jgi:hypothetical protein